MGKLRETQSQANVGTYRVLDPGESRVGHFSVGSQPLDATGDQTITPSRRRSAWNWVAQHGKYLANKVFGNLKYYTQFGNPITRRVTDSGDVYTNPYAIRPGGQAGAEMIDEVMGVDRGGYRTDAER